MNQKEVLLVAELKKILVTLPDNLLEEVDYAATEDKINRSELVREAMKMYLKERRRIQMREILKKGYLEMTEINLKLSEMYMQMDAEVQKGYEEKLAKCD